MKLKFTPPQFLLLLLIAMMLYSSCRKTDELIKDNSIISTEEKFFTQHRSHDATENALVNYIKQQNIELGFVNKTVSQIGYPRWNKTIAIKSRAKGIAGRETGGGDSSTLYYVPFVRDSQNYVNASMVISASATDTSFWYYCDWQYHQVENNPDVQVAPAEQMALFFMKLDNEVFGHKKFIINDTSLFDVEGNIATRVQFDSIKPGTDNLNYVLTCEDIAVSVWEPCQVSGLKSNTIIERDGWPKCQYTYWVYLCWYELDFGLPNTGGGGSGNGTGGGGTPPDCGEPQGRGISARGNLPCEEEPGWEPEPIEDPAFDDLYWIQNNVFDSSSNPCVDSVFNGLVNINNKLPNVVRDFFGVGPTFNLTFKVDYQNDTTSLNFPPVAWTQMDTITANFKTTFNSFYNGMTDLAYVTTLVHEVLHCQMMFQYTLVRHDSIQRRQLALNYGYIFPNLFSQDSALYQLATQSTTQHDFIMNLYRSKIADAVYQFAISKGINVTLNYCLDLAWLGAGDSQGWINLTAIEQQRILDIIASEEDPNGSKGININNVQPGGNPCN